MNGAEGVCLTGEVARGQHRCEDGALKKKSYRTLISQPARRKPASYLELPSCVELLQTIHRFLSVYGGCYSFTLLKRTRRSQTHSQASSKLALHCKGGLDSNKSERASLTTRIGSEAKRQTLTQIQGCFKASLAVILFPGLTVSIRWISVLASGVTVSHSGEGYCKEENASCDWENAKKRKQ